LHAILDINGSWNTVTGPNAPFNYAAGQDPYSFVQAITDWKAAKVPASQLVAGIAYYGRSATGKFVAAARHIDVEYVH
jgi:chitinase